MVSSGELKVLNIRPGLNKNQTKYQSEGTYTSAQWVRFEHGNPQKIGGFQDVYPTLQIFNGVARDALSWTDLLGEKFYSIGTNTNLYVLYGSQYNDITPIRSVRTNASCFNTTNNSLNVKVSLAAHGAVRGNLFTTTSVNVANLVFPTSNAFVITSANTNTFTFNAPVSANATTTNNGASTDFLFYIYSGLADNGAVSGWGAGGYGEGPYGEGSGATISVDLQQYTLKNYGEDLLANPRGQGIYLWDRTLGVNTRASIVNGAPTQVNLISVQSPPRILIAYGCSGAADGFSPLRVRWSSNENIYEWNPAVTNAAGELLLESGNKIVGVTDTRQEKLVHTDESVFRQAYIGGDFVFSIELAGNNCGLIAQHASVDVNGTVYWMGETGFFVYTGVVNKLECQVHDDLFSYVYGDGINFDQKEKIYAGVNKEFSEIWWFYPSRSAIENDSYVIYNYQYNLWSQGKIARTTWNDGNVFDRPIATATSGQTYYHEIGYDAANNTELPCRLDTGYFDIEDGNTMVLCDQFIPDIKDSTPQNSVVFSFKKFPQATEEFIKGPYPIDALDPPVVYFRGKGRQIALSYRCSGTGSFMQLGKMRLRIKPDGGR